MARSALNHKYTVPSNYNDIKKLRANQSFEIKNCKFLKPETKLRGYQTIGCLNMALMNNMILGDDPGLGKTIQTLTAYGIAKNANPKLKLLVLTTKSAKVQWGKEIDKFLNGVSYLVMKGNYRPEGAKRQLTGEKARRAQYDDAHKFDVFITGYYPLMQEPHFLAEAMGDNYMVVFDEVQAVKNHKSKAHLGAQIIVKGACRIYGLTATPIKNRLLEFYYIFSIIVPDLFPGVTKWKKEFTKEVLKSVPMGGRVRMIKEVVGYVNMDRFKEVIDPYFLRRSAEDVGKELPGIVSRKITFTMPKTQAKVYAEAKAGIVYQKRVQQTYFKMSEELENAESAGQELSNVFLDKYERISDKYEEILEGDFLKKNKNAALGFCQLAANGTKWLGDEDYDDSSGKEDALDDLLSGELDGQKVIIYTRYKSGIPRIQNILDKHDLTHVKVTGDEDDDQRSLAAEDFQKEDGADVIIITDAGSAAINLQSSGILLFFDTPWSWGDLVQVIGRARRIGSVHENVLVYHLVAEGTIDERVLDVLTLKKDINDMVLGKQAAGALEFDGDKPRSKQNVPDERSEVEILFDEIF